MTPRQKRGTIIAATILAVGWGMMAHEAAHAMVGWLVGGDPTVLVATEVKGDFSQLSPLGFIAFGIAGTLANVLLALLGARLLWRPGAPWNVRITGWLLFGVNSMLVVTKMLFEAVTGYGDWMTVLHAVPQTGVARVLIGGAGLVGMVLVVRLAGAGLASMVPDGEPGARVREARRILWISAATATVLVLGSVLVSPTGLSRSSALALGVVVGAFGPLFAAARLVPRRASAPDGPTAASSWLMVAAVATVILMWAVVGPGVNL